MTPKQITWTLGTLATVIVILSGMFALWPIVGWTIPNQHDNDFVVAINELKNFRDEWKCDEYDEELLDLQQEKAEARIEAIKVELQHEIDKLKRKMEKLECSRFEDFG